MIGINDIEKRFSHHVPDGTRAGCLAEMRAGAKSLAYTIVALTPEGREQSLALTKLEEVLFWANAAIARNETYGDPQ